MIGALVAMALSSIVATAVLLPVTVLVLAQFRLFPPLMFRVLGKQYRIPFTTGDRTTGISSTASSATAYVIGEVAIPTYATAAAFFVMIHMGEASKHSPPPTGNLSTPAIYAY
jgi:hypothetical protein